MAEPTIELSRWVEVEWKLHFQYIGMDCASIPIEEWGEYVAYENRARFGWSVDELGDFCPDLIAEQIAHLDEDDRQHYVEMILWFCDRHVVLAHEEPDLDEDDRHRRIEDELYDRAPGSLDLVSAVELNALDEGG